MNLNEDILENIGRLLVSETVATAESVTAGKLQFLLSQIKEASDNFKGGLTAYTLEEKVNLLGIDEEEGRSCDCVSPEIAQDMALQASHLFNTDYGIGVTGYATPVEESNFTLYAYFAIAYKMAIVISEKIDLPADLLGPDAQEEYAKIIITTFENLLALKTGKN